MDKNLNCDKMIIAILQGDDYQEAIRELNSNGFYATILNSSGGFLRKKSVTVMIGVNHEYLEEALQILKHYGDRTEMVYQSSVSMPGGVGLTGYAAFSAPPVSIPVRCGGVVLFVIDVERQERY